MFARWKQGKVSFRPLLCTTQLVTNLPRDPHQTAKKPATPPPSNGIRI